MKILPIKLLLYFLFSIIVIFFFKKINLIDFSILKKSYENNFNYLLLAVSAYFLSLIFSVLRFHELSKKINIKMSLKRAFNATACSIFLGQWLPGSAATVEAIRVGILSGVNKKINWKFIVSLGLWDRIFGLSNLFTLSFFIFIFSYFHLNNFIMIIVISLTILSLFGPVFILKILQKIFSINYSLNKYINYSKIYFYGFSSSVSLSLSYYLVSLSLDFEMNLFYIIIIMPWIALVSIIPLNFGNIGINQFGALFLFDLFNYKPIEIISVSILFGILLLICNSFFGIFFLKNTLKELKNTLLNKNEK